MDEFQDVLKSGTGDEQEALVARLRSGIQFLRHTPFVFAGSSRNLLHGIFNHPGSPFFKSASTLDIGPIARDEFATWIAARFVLGGRRVNRETLEQVFELAGDVPGDVQQLCAAIWDVTTPGAVFKDTELPAALARIWEQEQRSNETIVTDATDFQLRCLLALALAPQFTPASGELLALVGPSAQGPSVYRAFQAFERAGILMKSGPRFVFINPFFREWLKSRFP